MPTNTVRSLKSFSDIRRLLSIVIRQVMSGDMEVGKANAIGQLALVMIKVIKESEIEERLSKVEQSLTHRSQFKGVGPWTQKED